VSTAQPLIDIMSLVSKVAINAMVPASSLTVIIPEPVYLTALWQNAGILARVQYSQTGVVTTDLLKQLLGVKEVIQVASMSAGAGTGSRRLRRRDRASRTRTCGATPCGWA
jgi:hypothetical protein